MVAAVFHFRISIHAPHARSDIRSTNSTHHQYNFNPRSSCEERRVLPVVLSVSFTISIHAPHARSDLMVQLHVMLHKISIHAPHARSDAEPNCNSIGYTDFNPRSSCEERRTRIHGASKIYRFQSTLLMRGATRRMLTRPVAKVNFNPRSSCEERPAHRVAQ